MKQKFVLNYITKTTHQHSYSLSTFTKRENKRKEHIDNCHQLSIRITMLENNAKRELESSNLHYDHGH